MLYKCNYTLCDLLRLFFFTQDNALEISSFLISLVVPSQCPSLLPLFLLFIYLFIFYIWLRWVFVAVGGLSLVVASGGYSVWALERRLRSCSAQA